MTLQDVGDIGELVGAIGVIASMNLSLSSNPEFAELMLRARHQVEHAVPADA